MNQETRPPGKTTIATDVLLNIATLTTLGVEGVARMSENVGGVNKLIQRGQYDNGVKIHIEEDTVNVDLHVIIKNDVNIRQVSRTIQKEVARAISEMVGMDVGKINVFIEDNAETLARTSSESLKLKLLFNRLWNVAVNLDSLTRRVGSWSEIDEVVVSMPQK